MKEFSLNFTNSTKAAHNPFINVKSRPELDVAEFFSEEGYQLYQQMIGILRWTIELGRIDICT